MKQGGKNNRASIFWGAVVILALLAFALSVRFVPALVIKDSKGATIVRLPLYDGQFIHHFIHSVHTTPVDEYFEVHGTTLELTKVKYDTYGVGMPSDGGEGFSIEERPLCRLHAPDFFQHSHRCIDCSGPWSDHRRNVVALYTMGTARISNYALRGENADISEWEDFSKMSDSQKIQEENTAVDAQEILKNSTRKRTTAPMWASLRR